VAPSELSLSVMQHLFQGCKWNSHCQFLSFSLSLFPPPPPFLTLSLSLTKDWTWGLLLTSLVLASNQNSPTSTSVVTGITVTTSRCQLLSFTFHWCSWKRISRKGEPELPVSCGVCWAESVACLQVEGMEETCVPYLWLRWSCHQALNWWMGNKKPQHRLAYFCKSTDLL
jgi:hypothetical protein